MKRDDSSDILAQMAAGAADVHTRAKAMARLAAMYAGTNDKKTGKTFAGIVRDESEPADIRLGAYIVLFEVAGRRLDKLPPLNELRIPEDLDWPFVDQYLG